MTRNPKIDGKMMTKNTLKRHIKAFIQIAIKPVMRYYFLVPFSDDLISSMEMIYGFSI